MRRSVVYYVSGHGLGHAARAGEVVRALAALEVAEHIHVRTRAPAEMFGGFSGTPVTVHPVSIDAGAVEESALRIEPRLTLDAAMEVLGRRREILAAEQAFVRDSHAGVIASDAPFLAGEIGAASGVPCFAVTNFTWDWIFEPYTEQFPQYQEVVREVRTGYAAMTGWLRLPFAQPSGPFSRIWDVPLVARHPDRDREECLQLLGPAGGDARPRVLIGMRGGVPPETVLAALRDAPDFMFLYPGEWQGDVPENLHPFQVTDDVSFSDAISAADVMVAKLGYGSIADCIATQNTRLLWPPREGFREDEITARDAPAHLPMRELPLDDFERGNWGDHLRKLMEVPYPATPTRADGAEECARLLAGWLA